jgi:pyruvate dehydrogenase E1 component alpha subunit
VLECVTYRHMAHSTPLMDEKHREVDTLEERTQKDSLTKLKQELLLSGTKQGELDAMEVMLRDSVAADIQFALQSPFPAREEVFTDMYSS